MSDEPTAMELDLGRVEDRSTQTFDRTFDVPTPEGGVASCHALAIAEITRSGARYDIRTRVTGTVRLECHRCLGAFELPVETEFEIVVHRGDRSAPPEGAEEDDYLVLAAGEERYDIFPRAREALILEIPIKVLCREDCKGVCPRCGADLNAGKCGCAGSSGDSRWNALRKLVDRGDAS